MADEIKKPIAPYGSKVARIQTSVGVGIDALMAIDSKRHGCEMTLHAAGVVVKSKSGTMIVPYANLTYLMLAE